MSQKTTLSQVPDVNRVLDSLGASVQWMPEKGQCLKIPPVSAVGMTGFPLSVLTKAGKRKFKTRFYPLCIFCMRLFPPLA